MICTIMSFQPLNFTCFLLDPGRFLRRNTENFLVREAVSQDSEA